MNIVRVVFLTLLVVRELGIALPLSLLVACSIAGENWNKNLAASVTSLAQAFCFFKVQFLELVHSPPQLQTSYLQVIVLAFSYY